MKSDVCIRTCSFIHSFIHSNYIKIADKTLPGIVSTVTTERNDKNAEKVSHDAHPEFLNNIRTIKLLSIVEDVRVGS